MCYSDVTQCLSDTTEFPIAVNDEGNKWLTKNYTWWTTGMFSGYLWYASDILQDERFKRPAHLYTYQQIFNQFDARSHDAGFLIMKSFGNALKFGDLSETETARFNQIIVNAALAQTTRFSHVVNAIKSWNSSIHA